MITVIHKNSACECTVWGPTLPAGYHNKGDSRFSSRRREVVDVHVHALQRLLPQEEVKLRVVCW